MSSSKKGRLLLLVGMTMIVAVASLVLWAVAGRASATSRQEPTVAGKTGPPKTLWGEPDLQGIWSRDVDIPLERPAKYANQELFTDAERAELDRQIADIVSRDSTESRRARGTERDVNTEFAQAPFTVHLPVGRRTSLIVDPPDGKIPPHSRRRLKRPETTGDSSSSLSCSRPQPARKNSRAAPAASTAPCHRDGKKRLPRT
jgi:hypothetical protein